MDLSEFVSTLPLTAYEKKVILFLSSTDESTATKIAKETQTPQGRIYQVLNDLRQKKIVFELPVTPKRFFIKDVQTSLKNYIQAHTEKWNTKLSQVNTMTIPKKNTVAQKTPSVFLSQGREEHIQLLRNLLEETTHAFKRIAPFFRGTRKTQKLTLQKTEQGIPIQILITEITQTNAKNIQFHLELGSSVRLTKSENAFGYSVSDSAKALFGAEDYSQEQERIMIMTQNPGLVWTLEKNFDKLWKEARPLTLKSLKAFL
ncbi:MAG: sugar-specific transcriptional regulator TrmB [Candidatus Woesearchaeota archaeon]|jgi:sugar-specific transcriptional regulator TrmB